MKKINRFFSLHRVFVRIRKPFVLVKIFFENLWFYFPFILSDRDYDYAFLTDLMAAKLERMAKNFETAHLYEGWERDVADMRQVSCLLREISEEPWVELAESDFDDMSRSGVIHGVTLEDMIMRYESAYLSTLFERMRDRIRFWWW